MTLTTQEIARYKRHLVLHDVGGQGQQKLKAARVLVIGAGGLGSPVLLYLAAAGVGTIGVIDDDTVSLDNLQRQVIHTTASVGTSKVASAAATVAAINPHVVVEQHAERLTVRNVMALLAAYDLIADGSDNFRTRYLVNDACYFARKPLVTAALGPFDGYLSTYRAFESGPDGNPNPSYRCVFPEAPPPGTVPNCSEVGILGAVAGVMGTLMATEILKEIIDIGESMTGRMLIYDARATSFMTVKVAWDPDNPLTGRAASIKNLSIHEEAR
jgi:molybdopterin-synthase adenylyltransferase